MCHSFGIRDGNGRTSTAGLWRSPLLAHLPRYEVPPPPGERPAFAYEAYVDYLIHMFCLERARHCRDAGRGWDGPAWFGGGAGGGENKALLFDCAREVYWAQALTGWPASSRRVTSAPPDRCSPTVVSACTSRWQSS